MKIETVRQGVLLYLSEGHPHAGISGGNDGEGKGEDHTDDTDGCQDCGQYLVALSANLDHSFISILLLFVHRREGGLYTQSDGCNEEHYSHSCNDNV